MEGQRMNWKKRAFNTPKTMTLSEMQEWLQKRLDNAGQDQVVSTQEETQNAIETHTVLETDGGLSEVQSGDMEPSDPKV